MYMRMNIEAISDASLVRVIRRVAAATLLEIGATEETIYHAMLVIGEACGNVVRHAYDEPSLYEVSLEYGPDTLTVTVLDHGEGFDIKAERDGEHFGLSIMSQTAADLQIDSTPGERTLLRAEIPVEYESPDDAKLCRKMDRL